MVELRIPDADALEGVTDATVEDLPDFARASRERSPPAVTDVRRAAGRAVDAIPGLADLPAGSTVGITAGSRGIADLEAVLRAVVDGLRERELEPYVFPAMGSHGGATADGQLETLASLGITPDAVGCEFRASMEVERVAEDAAGRPVFAARDALDADAVLLVNRVKAHTDYEGSVESGLCKMAVVGLGKHLGAEAMHNAALADGFQAVVLERARLLFAETPVVGGIALVENADERAAVVEGVPVDRILEREPALLKRSKELLPRLPVGDLDLLIVDEMGKDVSGTGMDTNVLGRVLFHGQPEPGEPSISRVFVRSLTGESHGNALGVGLADFAHEDLLGDIDLTDTYVNVATSGEPARARLPLIVPSDRAALLLALSTTGVQRPEALRVARIRNTSQPDDLLVSEPVAADLAGRPDVDVGDPAPLAFDADGDLRSDL